eukprot:m.144339 g.144339  ORF g.144339 m.144339 type:complete len:346 (-) comp14123_c0_seq3:1315-2352(-)
MTMRTASTILLQGMARLSGLASRVGASTTCRAIRPIRQHQQPRLVTQMHRFASSSSSSGSFTPSGGMPWGWIIMAGTTVMGGVLVYVMGQPSPLELQYNPNPNMSVAAFLNRTSKNIEQMLQEQFGDAPRLILPPRMPELRQKYTLVLDLEGTLLERSWTPEHGWRTIKRPGVDHFLRYMLTLNYEIVIFSDKEVMDTTPLLDKLDPLGIVQHRVCRDKMRYFHGELIKDLEYLNRDLKSVIVVDDQRLNFCKHPNNGISIKKFDGSTDDRELFKLATFLKDVVVADVDDIRTVIEQYTDEDDLIGTYYENRMKALQAEKEKQEMLAQEAQEAAAKPQPRRSRWW